MCGPPGGINGFQCLLLLANVYLVLCFLPGASSGGFQPSLSRTSVAIILPPHHVADRCMQHLEVILQCIILIQGGPGHPLTKVTGPGIGGDINLRCHLGCCAHIAGCGHSAVAPQRCTGGCSHSMVTYQRHVGGWAM